MSTQTGSISFESTGAISQHVEQNYATLSQIKGQFATCGTGAATAAKVATIVPTDSGWTLYNGATVTVKFTSKNTAANPTLNVNGSGAKPIKDYAGNDLTKAAREWSEGAAMALTYDGSSWRIQDSNLMERVSSAETTIEQTASAIGLSASGTTTTIANPNLSPFFEATPFGTSGNSYWTNTFTTDAFTALEDGWAHFHRHNTGTAVQSNYFRMVACPSVIQGEVYTCLVEIRNITTNTATSHALYTQQSTDTQFWGSGGTKGYVDGYDGFALNNSGLAEGAHYFPMKARGITEHSTTGTRLIDFNWQVPADAEIECDVRISLYAGIYRGSWKPYSGSQLYTNRSEFKVTTDGISSTVSKIGAMKYFDTTYSYSNANIETYSAEGYTGGWNVTTSTDGTRTGDVVYLKVYDSDRKCYVYIKGTVTAVNSVNRLTVKSHGYEDTLPVATIKSTINQSAESVKIKASHVDIEGAAIFKDSGRLSAKTLNNTYDAKGAASTAETNAKNYADSMEVGGRNLLKGTADLTDDVSGGGVVEYGTDSIFGGVKTGKTQSSWTGIYMRLASIADMLVAGEKYTASIYVKTDEDRDVPFTAHRFTHKTNVGDGSLGTHSLKAGVWERLSVTFTATEGEDSSKTTTTARIESSQAVPLWWAAPKLEKGTKATDWTPAPEDIESSAISRTQRIYYQSASTAKPETPGTTYSNWVSDESGEPDKWTLKRMSYSSAKPYIYTCEQKQVMSGTISYTPVLLDDTTTVIDGGKIITGTVAANQIAANAVTADKIDVTDLQAIGATIGGFQIDTNSIHTKNVATTSNADNSIALSSADFTRTINGTSRAGLRLAMGDKFGVTGDGAIYASNVDLTGKITATSGTIGGANIDSSGKLQVPAAQITGDLSADRIKANVISAVNNGTGTINGNKINASQINIGSLAGEVGGRNLLLKTGTQESKTMPAVAAGSYTTWDPYTLVKQYSNLGLKEGDSITISFDWNVTSAAANSTVKIGTNVSPWEYFGVVITFASGNSSGHVEKTFKVTSALASCAGTTLRLRIDAVGTAITTNMVFTLTNVKLEKSSCATNWSPAPEDIPNTNLLRDSATGDGWTYSSFNPAICEYTRATTATSESVIQASLKADVVFGKTYTLSCYAKSNGYVSSMDMYKFNSNTANIQSRTSIALTTSYALYTFTFVANATETVTIRFDNNGSTTSGTNAILYIKQPKLEEGDTATAWIPAPEDAGRSSQYITANSTGIKIHKASDTSNYLYQTSDGTKIYKNNNLKADYGDTITLYGGSSTSGANPKITIGESVTDGGTARPSLCFYDNSGNQRLKINSGVGLIIGLESKGHTQITDAGAFFYDTNNKKRTQVDADGLHIFDASATPIEVALFGSTVGTSGTTAFARIGQNNSSRFEISPTTLSAYTGTTKYFEVSASGLKFGNFVAASTEYANSVTNGYTILWNYENFTTANNGEGYICKLDPAKREKSDANGTVMWNGVTRTITKGMVNPNAVHPYNTPCYVVCRLSSATATTGTNYIVSYNSGWKGGTINGGTLSAWTWNEATDMVLGKYVEPGSEQALIECEIYDPPLSSKQLTTSNVTAGRANATANDAKKTATNYITADSSGIKVHNAGDSSNYAHITSNGMEVYKSGTSVAEFGETARVGKADEANVKINPTGIQLSAPDGAQALEIESSATSMATKIEAQTGFGWDTLASNEKVTKTIPQITALASGTKFSVLLYARFTSGNTKTLKFPEINFEKGAVIASGAESTTGISLSVSCNAAGAISVRNTATSSVEVNVYAVRYDIPTYAPAFTFGTRDESEDVGGYSYSEGMSNIASGTASHAEGCETKASGSNSHAEGSDTIASGQSAHAEGYLTTASGLGSHAEGGATGSPQRTVASGDFSHAEGFNVEASGGYGAHAEGFYTIASGEHGAHAEGAGSEASKEASHAEGYYAKASGKYSHAEGNFTEASGDYSHAQNRKTIAASSSQTAIGKFNVSDTAGIYALIIGGGNDTSDRKDIFNVEWDGDTVQRGSIYYQGTKSKGRMIRFMDNTSGTDGNGVAIGAGGLAVLGAGESADNLITALSLAANNEDAYVSADGKVCIVPNCNTIANRKVFTFTTGGNLEAPGLFQGTNAHNAITAKISAELTLATAEADITLASDVKVGSGFSIASGGVKCAVAGTVSVTALVYFSGVTDQDQCNCSIKKGSTQVSHATARSSGNANSVALAEKLVTVAASDVLYLSAGNGNAARGKVPNYAAMTYMTVKYV